MQNGVNKNIESAKPEQKTKHGKKVLYIVLAALVVVSLALILTSVGKTLSSPFENSTHWDNPTIVDTAHKAQVNDQDVYTNPDSEYSVVVDKYSSRLTVLNDKWQVIAQNEFDTLATKIDKIINVAIGNNEIFVHGIKWDNDGSGIDNELIFRCSRYGEIKETIYCPADINVDDMSNLTHINFTTLEMSDESANDNASDIKVQNIEYKDNSLYITQVERGNIASVIKMTRGEDKKWDSEIIARTKSNTAIYQAFYSAENNKLLLEDIVKDIKQYDLNSNKVSDLCSAPYYSDKIAMREDGTILVYQLGNGEIQYYDGQKFSPVEQFVNATDSFNIQCLSRSNVDMQDLKIDMSNYPVYIGESATYQFLHMLKILAKWAAIVYLCVIVVVLAVIAIKRQKTLYEKGMLKKTTAIVCILVAVIGVSALYLVNQYTSIYDDAKDNVKFQASLAADSVNSTTADAIKNINSNIFFEDIKTSNNIDIQEKDFDNITNMYYELNKTSELICKNQEAISKNIFYSLFLYDIKREQLYNFGFSENKYQNSIAYNQDANSVAKLKSDGHLEGINSNENGQYLYYEKAIYDSQKNFLGSYTFGQYTKFIDSEFICNAGPVVTLLLLICLISLAFVVEADNISAALAKYKQRRKKHDKRAYCHLTRAMSFFLQLSIGADSVLAVLISKDIAQNSPGFYVIQEAGLEEFTFAIPITTAAVAAVLGIAVFMKLEEKFTSKTIFVVSAFFISVGYGLTVYAVTDNNFDLFVVAKAISGFFAGVIKTELYSIASSAGGEKERYPLVQGIGRTAMLATVVSVLIAGSLSSNYGYGSVYIFAAGAGALCILIGIIVIPRGIHFVKTKGVPITSVIRNYVLTPSQIEKNKQGLQTRLSATGVLKWLFSARILVLILFVILPYMSAKGYKTYFFPLYSTDFGLDKMTISTIYSLATVFAFIMVHPISALTKGLPYRNKIINGLLALSFVFLLFMGNGRIEWAILAMFLTMTIGRTFGTPFRMCWMRDCESRGYSVSQLHPVMYFIEETTNALQVVLFSICMVAGNNYACMFFGIYCLLSAIVFAIVSYNSPMRDGWKRKIK